MSELSGADLEVATAKALGWTAYVWNERTWLRNPSGAGRNGYYPLGDIMGYTGNEEFTWRECRPRYLSEPVLFASVLKALDKYDWKSHHQKKLGHHGRAFYSCTIYRDMLSAQTREGATFEEAVCRAVVAFKPETGTR